MNARIMKIWTDGAALGNPDGAMGWGWVDVNGKCDAGGAPLGTNQIGELTAIFMALRAHPTGHVRIYTDSQYCINVYTKWSKGWARNNWRKRDGSPVLNKPLIKATRVLLDEHDGLVEFEWVKGHAGHNGNETADRLAHDYAVEIKTGNNPERMPVEGRVTLDESYKDGGPTIRAAERAKNHTTRTLKHIEGETPSGHWKMTGRRYNNTMVKGPVASNGNGKTGAKRKTTGNPKNHGSRSRYPKH